MVIRALEAEVGPGPIDLSEIFAEDVTGWSPGGRGHVPGWHTAPADT